MKRWAVTLLALILQLPSLPATAADAVTPLTAAEFAARLEGLRGQVVLVNFWATWCRPCLKEIPELQALAERLSGREFVLLAVSLDDADSLDSAVRPFLQKWFPDFRSFASAERDMDAMVSVVDPAWNEILPTSYVIGRDGRVAARLQGGKRGEDFAAAVMPLLD